MPRKQQPTNGGDARLQSFVERVERVESDIADLNADKAEIYKEAKDEGWNVEAIKFVIGERRKRAKNPTLFDSLQSEIELYRAALGEPSRARAHTREDAETTVTLSGGGESVTMTGEEFHRAAASATAHLDAERRARA
ncbi:MAG: GapR family DNA-binding domain-containing protein [Alphaproteobacteria bacterium]